MPLCPFRLVPPAARSPALPWSRRLDIDGNAPRPTLRANAAPGLASGQSPHLLLQCLGERVMAGRADGGRPSRRRGASFGFAAARPADRAQQRGAVDEQTTVASASQPHWHASPCAKRAPVHPVLSEGGLCVACSPRLPMSRFPPNLRQPHHCHFARKPHAPRPRLGSLPAPSRGARSPQPASRTAALRDPPTRERCGKSRHPPSRFTSSGTFDGCRRRGLRPLRGGLCGGRPLQG